MSDVYQIPVSNLEMSSETYKPSIGWKVLFLFLLPLEVWAQYDTFTLNEFNEPFWWLITSFIIYSVYYIGLFGLAFSKTIGTSKFWLCYLPVQVTTDIYEIYILLSSGNEQLYLVLILLAIILPLTLVTWWSTYKYHSVINHF